MICLYEGSHTHDNNIKEGSAGGGVILWDTHKWAAMGGKKSHINGKGLKEKKQILINNF